MHQLEEILIPLIIFSTIFFVIKLVTEYRLKRMLIDRGLVSEGKQLFTESPFGNPLNSFKWGMVLIGIGLAILLREVMPTVITEQAMVALMFLFAGVSFLLYYSKIKDVQVNNAA